MSVMAKKRGSWKIWAVAAGVALVIGGLAGNGEEKDEPTRSAVVTETPEPTAAPTPTPKPTETPVPTDTPEPTPYRIRGMDPQTTVYVSRNGVIHFKHDCSGMKNYTEMTLEKAVEAGYKYCEHCG